MEKIKDVIINKGHLRWLMKITLVLGLITFSGHVSAFRPSNVDPVKTELTEIGRVTFKKTICFKKAIEGLSSSVFITFSQSNNFTPYLLQFSNNIKVKLKDNVSEFKAFKRQDKYFLTNYSSTNSEESNTDRPKG